MPNVKTKPAPALGPLLPPGRERRAVLAVRRDLARVLRRLEAARDRATSLPVSFLDTACRSALDALHDLAAETGTRRPGLR